MSDTKQRILVVDDEPDLTMLTKMNLERTGRYEVQEVNQAKRCLPTARMFRPALILLDIVMPDMEGTEVAAQIRNDAQLGSTPIIFMTAVVSRDEAKMYRDGMQGNPVLAKPVPVDELVQAIDLEIASRP